MTDREDSAVSGFNSADSARAVRTRIDGTTTRIKCPFVRGSVFLHTYRDESGRIAYQALSHQIQDDRPPKERSVMAETLDLISQALRESTEVGDVWRSLAVGGGRNPDPDRG